MDFPDELKYTEEHEWVLVDGDTALIGITEFAQNQLGEIIYVELPENGDQLEPGKPFGVVESAKAVTDVFAPISGEVIEVNEELPDAPETINSSPYEEGWLVRIRVTDQSELDDLLDAAAYEEFVEDQE